MEISIMIGDLWLRLKIDIQVHVKVITSWNYLLGNDIREKFIFTVGHAMAQLVEALRYKSEGRGFYSRRCHWNFSLT